MGDYLASNHITINDKSYKDLKKCKITFWVEISKLVGEGIPHLLPELLTLSSKPPIFHLQFRHLEILGCTWRCAWLTSLCGWGGTNLCDFLSE